MQSELDETIEKSSTDFRVGRDRPRDAEQRAQDVAEALDRAQRKLAAANMRLQAAEVDRDSWRVKYQTAARERDRERSLVIALERSTSYRIGRALVLFAKNPIKTTPWLVRAILRRLKARLRARRIQTNGVGNSASPPIATAKVSQPVGSTTGTQVSRGPILSERLPVHAYVALGFDPDALRSFARAVGQCALASANHVPLIVTDSPSFALLRDTGIAIEYIPDRQTWEHHCGDTRDLFLSNRLGRLLRVHQPARTIIVNQCDALGLPQLLTLTAEFS